MLVTIIGLPLVGYLSDRLPSRIFIPLAFALRCLTGTMFLQINDPRKPLSIALCVLYVISSSLENISVEACYFKGIPADVRGTMLGLFWFFAFLGTLAFTAVGGYLYDKAGPIAPFGLLLILDLVYLTVVIILSLCGKLKEKTQ